ncbi:CO/xanthine dehydrogenase FAD-binding subunit [Bradyrhizobium sp. GM0.4]
MKQFDYVRPATVAEAVAAATQPGAVYLAAGTNLLDLMKGGVSRPDRLVDVTHLDGLDRGRAPRRRWYPHRRTGEQRRSCA